MFGTFLTGSQTYRRLAAFFNTGVFAIQVTFLACADGHSLFTDTIFIFAVTIAAGKFFTGAGETIFLGIFKIGFADTIFIAGQSGNRIDRCTAV